MDHAVSLKVLAERHIDGVKKTTQFKIDPRIIEIEEGFNARPLDKDHIEEFKVSYKTGAVLPPVFVRVEEGRIILIDGHHRVAALMKLIADGEDIVSIDAIQFRGNDADRVAHMLTSAQGLPLTPLQMGSAYKRLVNFGWGVKEISARVGKTYTHVSEMLKLTEANSDVRGMVERKEVAAHTALKLVRKHGEKAGQVASAHLETAKKNGKKKVTAKIINKISLIQAIRNEMAGGEMAEEVCPEYALEILYLRDSLRDSLDK